MHVNLIMLHSDTNSNFAKDNFVHSIDVANYYLSYSRIQVDIMFFVYFVNFLKMKMFEHLYSNHPNFIFLVIIAKL